MKEFEDLLARLADSDIEFIVIGGIAGAIHGAARPTYDLDIVYRRTPENLERLSSGLAVIHPALRGADTGLPFRLDMRTLKAGLNFTLRTDEGELDLLGEVTGGGSYDDLIPFSSRATMFGRQFQVVNLDKLIELKRAAGRRKDFEAIAELELIRDGGPDG